MADSIRIAVIGAGAFGRNHLRVLHALSQRPNPEPLTAQAPSPQLGTEPATSARLNQPAQFEAAAQPDPPSVHLAAVVDSNADTRAAVAASYNIPAFSTVEDLLSANLDLHAATVAVPTVLHAQVAAQLLGAGLDVLIEKPLTATLAEADALIALARQKGRILAAGHLERFNPAVSAALARLTRPMFFEAHRLSIFTPRSLDVDVVLDLMIHDLDILLTMAQPITGAPVSAASPVSEVRAVGLPVLSRKVDIANVRLEFRSGAIANLTASRVSTEQVRKLRLFQPAQYLSLDYARQELLTINVDPSLADRMANRSMASDPVISPHPSAGLNLQKLELPRAEPLRLELEDFLHAVKTRQPPRVSGEAARDALQLALQINQAIAGHNARTGLY